MTPDWSFLPADLRRLSRSLKICTATSLDLFTRFLTAWREREGEGGKEGEGEREGGRGRERGREREGRREREREREGEGGREGGRGRERERTLDTRLTPTRGYTSRDSLPCLLGRAVDLI